MKHFNYLLVNLTAIARLFAHRTAAALLAIALFSSSGVPGARAATAASNYWDPGRTGTTPGSGGSGTWDFGTANWVQSPNGGDHAYVNGGVAYFEGAAGTVSLNASGVSARDVLFYTGGYVLQDAPGTSYALTVGGGGISTSNTSGTVTISTPLNLTGNLAGFFLATGSTLSVTGNLTTQYNLGTNGGTLILSGNNALTGIIEEGGGTLQLAGTGANQPLGGASGVSIIQGGTLLYAAGSSNQIPTGVPVSLGNGTFNVNGQSQDRVHTLGALTLSSSSALDFGSGVSVSSVLAFGKSSTVAWSGTLSVYDYRGTSGTGGGVDELFFGTDATGLTASQLSEISFYSGGAGSTLLGTGIILGNGEVTYAPVPEPATWLGGALSGLAALCGVSSRSRRTRHS